MADQPFVKRENHPGRKRLEGILQRTLAVAHPLEELTSADLQALEAVVLRHPGHPFTLEPVAAELVGAILGSHFEGWGGPVERWRAMSASISQSLFEDPASHDCLERLWHHLSRRSP